MDKVLSPERKPSAGSLRKPQEILAPIAVDISISSSEDLDKIAVPSSPEASPEPESKQEKIAPCFVIDLQDKQVVEGESVQLEARVTGHPRPTFSWLKDDDDVTLNSRIRVHEDGEWVRLEIVDVELDDEADYVCVARNEVGETESFAELLVDGEICFILFLRSTRADFLTITNWTH